jgi:hypothetical protein
MLVFAAVPGAFASPGTWLSTGTDVNLRNTAKARIAAATQIASSSRFLISCLLFSVKCSCLREDVTPRGTSSRSRGCVDMIENNG